MLGGYAEEAGARSSIRARGGGAVAGATLGGYAYAPYARESNTTRHAVNGVTSCEAEARAKT